MVQVFANFYTLDFHMHEFDYCKWCKSAVTFCISCVKIFSANCRILGLQWLKAGKSAHARKGRENKRRRSYGWKSLLRSKAPYNDPCLFVPLFSPAIHSDVFKIVYNINFTSAASWPSSAVMHTTVLNKTQFKSLITKSVWSRQRNKLSQSNLAHPRSILLLY